MSERPGDWQAHADTCRKALQTQGPEAARNHLLAGLAAAGEDIPLPLRLLEAEILQAEGLMARAEAGLITAATNFPRNPWPPFLLARLCLERKSMQEARRHLDRARQLDARGLLTQMPIVEAELGLESGNAATGLAALNPVVKDSPDHPALPGLLERLARMPGGALLSLSLFREALERAADPAPLKPGFARLLSRTRPAEAAMDEIGALWDEAAPDLAVGLELARACHGAEAHGREEAVLLALFPGHATDPALLQHMFDLHIAKADGAALKAVIEALDGHMEPDLLEEFRIQAALHGGQPHAALRLIRQGGREAPHKAQRLARALFGAGQYETGYRYLRRCLRRWPTAQGLVVFFLTWAGRLGRISEIAPVLERAEPGLSARETAAHRLVLAGLENDLEAAIAHYAALRAARATTRQHREIMARLIFTRADLDRLDALYARIGNPASEEAELLHRGGIAGNLTLELELALRDHDGAAMAADPAGYCRARPGSTVAAIRMIDACMEADPGQNQGQAGTHKPAGQTAIPKRIFQFREEGTTPEAQAEIAKSWAGLAGYEHEVLTRAGARDFLRAECGPKWVRAFDLARAPQEAVDLLRLCLLARRGGIWADADSHLYGDLDGILAGAGRLVIYRDIMGGAIGTGVIAAPPGHPVIAYAAQLARAALLSRSADIAWSKTGPGVLTRAVAQFLAHPEIDTPMQRLCILGHDRLARVVAMGHPVDRKPEPRYWDKSSGRFRPSHLWPGLVTALSP